MIFFKFLSWAVVSPLNLDLKAGKQLQNKNHTDDRTLGSHPRDNGHVNQDQRSSVLMLYKYIAKFS